MQRTDLKELIRKACENDLSVIADLAKFVRGNMVLSGLEQWVGDYPNIDNFRKDFLNDGLFVLVLDNEIIGSCSILKENDVAYKEVVWNGINALVVHRILVSPKHQGKGYGKDLLIYALEKARLEGYDAVKIDTHPDNIKMQRMLKSMGFSFKGYLASINRLAFEKMV